MSGEITVEKQGRPQALLGDLSTLFWQHGMPVDFSGHVAQFTTRAWMHKSTRASLDFLGISHEMFFFFSFLGSVSNPTYQAPFPC